ncbi:hypothetical protein MB02_11575 [Croceicoccus estronivorus]|nr:hypothetical protein MB02_11575 [Croceicoccus estronivorus]
MITGAPVRAQGVDQLPNVASETRIEDIVVTARRREERVQTVPVALTAINGETLERLGIQQPDKLQNIVPNLASTPMPSVAGGSVTFIRGVGTTELLLSVDSPVGTYVDGVYLGRNVIANLGVIAPARVEVLRGPQGTLFGRNTTGGAISITTPKPDADFALQLKGGLASFHERYGQFRLDTGEIGTTGLSALVAYQHKESHGIINNPLAPGKEDPGASNSDAIFAKVHGEWGSLKIDYSFDYANLHAATGAFQIGYATAAFRDYYAQSSGFNGAELIIDPERRDTLPFRRMGRQAVTSYGHALIAAADISDTLTLKSITAYRHYKADQPNPYAPSGILGPTTTGIAEIYPFQSDIGTVRTQHQFSEEIQLLGTFDQFEFVLGGFYFNEKAEEIAPTSYTYLLPPDKNTGLNLTGATNYAVSADSYAVFGQGTYRPAFAGDKLELTLGARYTKDEKSIDQTRATVRSARRKYNNFSYNLSLAYKLLPETLLFGRIGTGYRSGGFNARAGAGVDFVFKPEKVTSYEFGLKSDWLDGMLRTNFAAFYTDYSNLQVTQYTGSAGGGGTGFTRNANATLKGFELETVLVPVKGLRIEGSTGYVQARFDEIYFPDPISGDLTNFADISHLPYVPAWTAHAAAQYAFQPFANDIRTSVRVDYSWRSRRWFHTNNLSNLNPFNDEIADGAYGLLGASIVMGNIPFGSLRGEVSLWGENLTNTEYRIQGVDFGALGFAGNVYGNPRRFGVDFKVDF